MNEPAAQGERAAPALLIIASLVPRSSLVKYPTRWGRRAMKTLVAVMLLGLILPACSMTSRADLEAALFAELFDVPRGSCRQLAEELWGEIEATKIAKKKARDDFVAEHEAPAKGAKSPRSSRKDDPFAALREWAARSERAEKWNLALKERGCESVDIEAAVK
jgi:hypothetical protein